MGKRRHLAPWGRKALGLRALAGGWGGGLEAEALAALEGKPALYHCVSRVVWRELVLGAVEKECFVRLMRRWEAFCQVRVLTYCVMDNHFHILVEVPERPEQDPSDGELVEHLGLIYGAGTVEWVRQELAGWRATGQEERAEGLRERFLARMWDLSWFMRQLKQAYTRWFNKRHGKKGHLWEEKFKSVLVEEGRAARVVAGYIDLNPVRAGIVGEAGDYRWSGWGEAEAGEGKAREGIVQVMVERELGMAGAERAVAEGWDWRRARRAYAGLMAEDRGRESGRESERERSGEGAGSGGAGKGVAARRGRPVREARVGEGEMMRRKVRYFVDGMVIGTREFVDGVFRLTREWFPEKRRDGARRMAGAETELRTMRELRVRVMG